MGTKRTRAQQKLLLKKPFAKKFVEWQNSLGKNGWSILVCGAAFVIL